jgi:cation diffusion facilitator family transporter
MSGETRTSVVAAVAGNLLIATIKFVAAAVSGSAAMLSEGIHSLVDTANNALMLYGLRRSKRPPDGDHPFGYGREVYFWTLTAGMLFFAVGGGMSVLTGLRHLADPEVPHDVGWNYAVLGAGFIFEGGSWLFGYRAFRAEQRGRSVVATIRRTKDPMAFAVLLEDSAALLGLALAFAGIAGATTLGAAWMDGASSLVIGVLLCLVALIMVYESKELLIGEGMERGALEQLRTIVQSESPVEELRKLATLYLSPDEIVLVLDLRFRDGTEIEEIRRTLTHIGKSVRARFPRIRRILVDSTAVGP